jgi:hypothetical protein
MNQKKHNKNSSRKGSASASRKTKKSSMRGTLSEYDPSASNLALRVPRRIGLILPDRYRTGLRYWKSVSTSLAVANSAAFRFSPSNAFDVDPLFGGTNMSGFVELATLYSTYRVIASHIKCETVNPSSTQPVMTYVAPLNVDPGAAPSAAFILSLKEQPYAVSKTATLAGGPICTLDNVMSTERIFGSKSALFDDNFAAPVTGGPTNNWYWVVGLYAFNVIAPAVFTNITIEVDVEFFNRKDLLS